MRAARHSVGFTCFVFAAAAAACLGVALGGCGLGTGAADDAGDAEARATLTAADEAFAAAAAAVLTGDRERFIDLLPDNGTQPSLTARDDLADIFDTLSPLPWRTFAFEVSLADAERGIYRVRGTGQLGEAGPADRIAVVRYLELEAADGGVAVTGDETPDDVSGRYLMALHEPLVLQRFGLIVLGDRRARGRAEVVMTAAARARPRLEDLGIDTRPTVVVTVYGSAADVRDALGVDASTSRLVFFAHPPLRAAEEYWPTYDVGVMGPWLSDTGAAIEGVLMHELAHAYTMCWFGDDEHPPSLLVEGIAQAAEGSPVAASLREEVATGDQLWPLPESFAESDIWAGGDGAAVRLGYQVGAALVDYVVSHWGAAQLQPFVQAVAKAEPTEAGMDEALAECLGVGWRAFYDGWRRYVLDGG